VEVKPKSAATNSSLPFVPPGRRMGYAVTAFALSTLALERGWMVKGLQGEDDGGGRRSPGAGEERHDPADIFSGDGVWERRAVACMREDPRNNFRIWHRGHACSLRSRDAAGSNDASAKSGPAKEAAHSLLNVLVPRLAAALDDLVALALRRSGVLTGLRAMHALDPIDRDRAHAALDHLVDLCGGDAARELDALDLRGLLEPNDEGPVRPLPALS